MFNEYNNWSEINQSNCTVDGRKLVWFSNVVNDIENVSEGLQRNFGEFSNIVENDILTMQRFLDVSRFLYSGGWQVCGW